MSKTRRKKSSAGKSIAIFFIVFMILEGLLIFGLKTIFKNEDSAPSLGGYSLFLMDTDNMSPTVPKNTLVIAVNGTPSVDKIKSAVLCRNVGDEGTTVAWLAEIGSKGDTVDGVIYTVYQDNVAGQDSTENVRYYDVGSTDVVGVATSRYDTAGKIISFVITPFGMVICGAVPLVLLILLEIIVALTHRSDDVYETEEYDDTQADYDDEEEQDSENVSLDDFLYGGSEDDVYNSGSKPAADYSEEFEELEERQAPISEEPPAPRPVKRKSGKPDFVLHIPNDEEDAADPFGDDEEEQEDTKVYGEPESFEEDIPEEEPALSDVDRMYYEKAARLIEGDDYVPAPAPKAKPAPAEPPVQLEKPAVRAAAPEAPAAPAPARRAPASSAQGARRRPTQGGVSGAPRRRPASGVPSRQGGAAPKRRPRPTQSRPAQRRAPHKDANAALEQLMQKMAEEQKKLGGDNKE